MLSAANVALDEEEFHSSFRIYFFALEMLAASPDDQCRLMGDVNVAWELKQDVQAGQHLIGRGYLNAEEEYWIAALASALDSINAQVLPAGGGREVNLVAMSHVSWVPARFLAAEVVRMLASSASSNAEFLGLAGDAANQSDRAVTC